MEVLIVVLGRHGFRQAVDANLIGREFFQAGVGAEGVVDRDSFFDRRSGLTG